MSFRAVNSSPTVADPHPTTIIMDSDPKLTSAPHANDDSIVLDAPAEDLNAKTPTRETFSGMALQKPLPDLPLPAEPKADRLDSNMHDVESKPLPPIKSEQDQPQEPTSSPVLESVQEPQQGQPDDGMQDVEMEDFKDAKDSSEQDSADGDGRPSKKKRSVRFWCTDYPPCNLSFTRSEHLARHIRKHTGERPFQCHCNRRFSRLDNLRQHAQTVHVNEDIPIDSLAATGTRFQRQVRTDRVRPINRSRASTLSSLSSPAHSHRGHSRNLSSSSITSMSSVSSYAADEPRRPLFGFETPRANRLSLDTYSVPTSNPASTQPMQPYYTVGTSSPTGYSTPTSATFSMANSSPRFSSGLHSPASSISRGLQIGSVKTPHRRLSIPGSQAFQSSQSPDTQSSFMSPVPSHAAIARNSAYLGSTAGPAPESRRDSLAAAEAEWRRRTWHPNTDTQLRARPATSHAAPQHIADLPRPVFPSQQTSSQLPTLPGIHTFDQPPPPPSKLLGPRPPSPMQLDTPAVPPVPSVQPAPAGDNSANRVSWTSTLQSGLTRLEINAEAKPHHPQSWNPANPNAGASEASYSPLAGHARHHSDETATVARKNRRMGWYMQPPQVPQVPQSQPQRPSPESISSDGAPTPVTAAPDYHPAIAHSNGHLESQTHSKPMEEPMKNIPGPIHHPVQPSSNQLHQSHPHLNPFGLPRVHEHPQKEPFPSFNERAPGLGRLEALVAVATSEQQRI